MGARAIKANFRAPGKKGGGHQGGPKAAFFFGKDFFPGPDRVQAFPKIFFFPKKPEKAGGMSLGGGGENRAPGR